MSRFTDKMFHNARTSTKGMVTGEPHEPVRHTWGEVHERARRIAGGLAAAGVGHGDAVGVLAGAPVEIAPTAQALWMRGASLTMLHQPTPRTDLELWAKDTANVIDMIEAKAVVISDPFLAAAPVLAERGVKVLTVEELLTAEPIDPVETGEDIASADYLGLLESVPALRAPVTELVGAEPTPGEVASAVELILEGLHLSKRLNKDAVGGRAQYRSR